MARIYGLNGALRGRQGNNVFSVQNGTQVVKAYQPVVANPRTSAQREQRTKFALAGKLSGATPNLALSGLTGSNPRAKRSRFVSLVTKGASVTNTAGDIVALIALDSIIWSEGSLARFSSSFTATAAYGGNNVVVTVPAMSLVSGSPAGYGETVVVGLFDDKNIVLDEIQCAIRSTTDAATFNFRETPTRVAVTVGVWICPYVTRSELMGNSVSNLYPVDDSVAVQMSPRSVLSGCNWGNSRNVQVLHVAAPQQSIAPLDGDSSRGMVEDALLETTVSSKRIKK